jgi:hypothetical protein
MWPPNGDAAGSLKGPHEGHDRVTTPVPHREGRHDQACVVAQQRCEGLEVLPLESVDIAPKQRALVRARMR